MKADVLNLKKQVVGSVELPEAVFGQRVNEALVLQVIKAQLAGVRQGTAASKQKGEVRGGGRKYFKQRVLAMRVKAQRSHFHLVVAAL